MKHLSLAAILGMLLFAWGCGPRVGNLAGEVHVDNKPLPTGRLSLQCEAGDKPVFFAIIHEGRYRLEEVPVGPASITVETFPPSVPGPKPPESSAPMNELPVEGMEDIPKIELLGPYVPLPAKYHDPTKSGLTVNVIGGEQTHDLQLEGLKK